jgi:predicted phosphodiesterase
MAKFPRDRRHDCELSSTPGGLTPHPPNRRQFLSAAAAGLTAASLATRTTLGQAAKEEGEPRAAFFVVGDTHYLADKQQPSRMDGPSAEICGRLVETLNRLPGEAVPAEAGGGKVAEIAGVIHVGDVIDTGDKQGAVHEQMQKTEWAAFADDYGLTGDEGRLKLPVYEVFGNHDAPHGSGWALEQIKQRNKRRRDVVNVSENGLHYSWNWGPAHFVNLGLIVGGDKRIERKRRYAALDSLDFLIADLKEQVADSGRPVILTHHVDIARYTRDCEGDAPYASQEWDPCDVRAFYEAIREYHVAAIFYGHTHARNVFQWDGRSAKATSGLHVFNTDNASHFGGDHQAFLYVELHADRLSIREYQTKDRWQSGFFTPQTWSAPFAV